MEPLGSETYAPSTRSSLREGQVTMLTVTVAHTPPRGSLQPRDPVCNAETARDTHVGVDTA